MDPSNTNWCKPGDWRTGCGTSCTPLQGWSPPSPPRPPPPASASTGSCPSGRASPRSVVQVDLETNISASKGTASQIKVTCPTLNGVAGLLKPGRPLDAMFRALLGSNTTTTAHFTVAPLLCPLRCPVAHNPERKAKLVHNIYLHRLIGWCQFFELVLIWYNMGRGFSLGLSLSSNFRLKIRKKGLHQKYTLLNLSKHFHQDQYGEGFSHLNELELCKILV